MPMLPLHPLTHLHSSTVYPPSLHYSFIHLSVHSSNKAHQQVILIHTAMLPLPECSFCLPSFDTNSSSYQGFPGNSEVKASACTVGDPGSIPGLGRSPGEGNGNPLQYSCLENPMDGGAWWLQSTGSQRVAHNSATQQHTQSS